MNEKSESIYKNKFRDAVGVPKNSTTPKENKSGHPEVSSK